MSNPNEGGTPPLSSADSEGVALPDPGGFDAHTHMDILGLRSEDVV